MNKLFYLRKNAGISQTDLALASGVHQVSISLWENGKALPNPDQARRIAIALSKDLEDIFVLKMVPTPVGFREV